MIAKARPINGTLPKRWVNLWGQALKDRDPQKLTEMLAKIDRMLQESKIVSTVTRREAISSNLSTEGNLM
jgi:hypothetical protein